MKPNLEFNEVLQLWWQRQAAQQSPLSEADYQALLRQSQQGSDLAKRQLLLNPHSARRFFKESTRQSPLFKPGYGMLKAAATTKPEPRVSISSCERFQLQVLPALTASQPSLVLLTVLVPEWVTPLEQQALAVRDKSGQVILRGSLQGGRLAGHWSGDIDLSLWTVQPS